MNHRPTTCPECHAVAYLQDEDCWQCGVTLTPGCPSCKHPVETALLSRGMCFYCGTTIKHFDLVRPWTTTG